MKKLMILAIVATGLFADACVATRYIQDPLEQKKYELVEVCIDKVLYSADVSYGALNNVAPMLVYKDGKAVQKACTCEITVNERATASK